MILHGKIRFKKVCKRCNKLFRPTGRHEEVCLNCYIKSRKRVKIPCIEYNSA
jgi:rRNA maturation endonuclease Nob1